MRIARRADDARAHQLTEPGARPRERSPGGARELGHRRGATPDGGRERDVAGILRQQRHAACEHVLDGSGRDGPAPHEAPGASHHVSRLHGEPQGLLHPEHVLRARADRVTEPASVEHVLGAERGDDQPSDRVGGERFALDPPCLAVLDERVHLRAGPCAHDERRARGGGARRMGDLRQRGAEAAVDRVRVVDDDHAAPALEAQREPATERLDAQLPRAIGIDRHRDALARAAERGHPARELHPVFGGEPRHHFRDEHELGELAHERVHRLALARLDRDPVHAVELHAVAQLAQRARLARARVTDERDQGPRLGARDRRLQLVERRALVVLDVARREHVAGDRVGRLASERHPEGRRERVDDLAGRREAGRRVLLEQPRDDRPDGGGHPIGQRRRRLGAMIPEHVARRSSGGGERDGPGEHPVERDPERVQIAARIERLTSDGLGRHVGVRAHERHALARAERAGDPEVEQHQRVLFEVHQDVGGLDVAMEHAARVQVVERATELGHEAEASRRGDLEVGLVEADPGHETLREEGGISEPPEVVDVGEVRVVQRREHGELAAQRLARPRAARAAGADLQRDRAVLPLVERFVHLAVAAARDRSDQPVASGDLRARRERGRTRSPGHRRAGRGIEARRVRGVGPLSVCRREDDRLGVVARPRSCRRHPAILPEGALVPR